MISELQYDEFKHVGTDYGSVDEVADYDRRMQKMRDIPRESALILDALQLSPDSTILEIGTGTGEFAIAASNRCSKVYAVDVSPVMLQYAKRKADDRGAANIDFIHAGFLSYEHKAAPVDAVVSQLALHHLPDFWKMVALRRIHGMLVNGGRLYLKDVVFSVNAIENPANHFGPFIRGIENSTGADVAETIRSHIRDEFSTLDWIMEGMLQRSGFTIVDARYEHGFFAAYLCTKT
ncbi:MAG: class I SAM-dependent methyltransferase [Armatimonadota bacterium]